MRKKTKNLPNCQACDSEESFLKNWNSFWQGAVRHRVRHSLSDRSPHDRLTFKKTNLFGLSKSDFKLWNLSCLKLFATCGRFVLKVFFQIKTIERWDSQLNRTSEWKVKSKKRKVKKAKLRICKVKKGSPLRASIKHRWMIIQLELDSASASLPVACRSLTSSRTRSYFNSLTLNFDFSISSTFVGTFLRRAHLLSSEKYKALDFEFLCCGCLLTSSEKTLKRGNQISGI